jgi:hypothetical protein
LRWQLTPVVMLENSWGQTWQQCQEACCAELKQRRVLLLVVVLLMAPGVYQLPLEPVLPGGLG